MDAGSDAPPADPRVTVEPPYPSNCPPPTLQGDGGPLGPNPSQLLVEISVPNVTDNDVNTEGAAFVNLNQDGMIDVVVAQGTVHAAINQGCFVFQPHDPNVNEPPEDLNVPTFEDFDHDGFLDMYLPSSGQNASSRFYLSQGTWDTFQDYAPAMGVTNTGAYARGNVSVADLDGDGYFDMVVGANQIGGSLALGRDLQRFYVYQPASDGVYEHGQFVDLGGTAIVAGFGGEDPAVCRPGIDMNGMGLALRDLDDDGRLDLVWLTHNDMTYSTGDGSPFAVSAWNGPCATGQDPYGIYAWQNQTNAGGPLAFNPVAPGPGSLAQHGQMTFNQTLDYYTVEAHAVGHEAVAVADVDNDGDLDVLTTGPTSPGWHVNSDPIMGTYWRNEGAFQFTDSTAAVGLSMLNSTLGDWEAFWGQATIAGVSGPGEANEPTCAETQDAPLCDDKAYSSQLLYPGMSLFADFDNDGWLDLLVTVRMDTYQPEPRNLLFMNNGDGTFQAVPTAVGGMDKLSLGAQAVDLNGDGLLDIFLMARQSGSQSPEDDLRNKVFLNTGAWGDGNAHQNHWINVRLAGLPHEQLIGAKVLAFDGANQLLGRQDYLIDIFRGSHNPMVHFGLGSHTTLQLSVTLPSGKTLSFSDLPIDDTVSLDVGAP